MSASEASALQSLWAPTSVDHMDLADRFASPSRRSRSSKFNEVDHHPIPSTASYPESSSDAHHRITPLRPIAFIEDAVKQWAAFNGQSS